MEFGFQFGTSGSRQPARPAEGTPFRILVLADLRGSAAGSNDPRVTRTTRIDVDDFDTIFTRFCPELEIPGGSGDGASSVVFHSLDDFHPDALYTRLELFRALRKTRDELNNPATFAVAMARLQAQQAPAASAPAAGAAKESDAAALERLLGRPAGSAPSSAGKEIPGEAIASLLQQVVAPYIVPGRDPRADTLVASVDAAIEGLMRAILRSPGFRALESAWRGVHELVTSEACGEDVEVHVLDAPQPLVTADLASHSSALERSVLARAVLGEPDNTAGKRWALVIGAYAFGPDEESLRTLAALGAIARRAGGAFVAGAEPALLGCASFATQSSSADWAPLAADAAAAWTALRRSDGASWIALAAPRVMMRRPYGRKSDPIERFAFEETPAGDHEALPWGHPGFAVAQLLAASFAARGFEMEPGDHRDLGERPVYMWTMDGETTMAPCAEAFLSEATTTAMLDRGILALASVRNRPALVVPRFQSIADPPASLSGPWR